MPSSLTRNLVTGGAGFLGSHLCDHLMDAGEEVICLDNYFTGRKANVVQWIGHPRFELIRHDVTEPIKLEVDRIWHLACPASPVHYQFNPVKTAKTSFLAVGIITRSHLPGVICARSCARRLAQKQRNVVVMGDLTRVTDC